MLVPYTSPARQLMFIPSSPLSLAAASFAALCLLPCSRTAAQSLSVDLEAVTDITVVAAPSGGGLPDIQTVVAGTPIADGFALDALRPGSSAHVDATLDDHLRLVSICQSASAQVGTDTGAIGRAGQNVYRARFLPTRAYSGDLVVRWNGLSQNAGDGSAIVEVDVGADGSVDFVAFDGQVRSVSFGRAFGPATPLEIEISMVSEAFGTTLSAFHGVVDLEFVPDAQTVAPGSFLAVGFGCPSSTGLAPFLVEAPPLTGPLVGEDWVTEVRQYPPAATMAIGVLGLMPIPPADLTPLGAPFCFLFQTAPVAVGLPAPDPDGILRWSFTVPDRSDLIGFTFHQQAIVLDPGANAFGLVVSNAGVSTIGGQ